MFRQVLLRASLLPCGLEILAGDLGRPSPQYTINKDAYLLPGSILIFP
jgi:hypothetical protein